MNLYLRTTINMCEPLTVWKFMARKCYNDNCQFMEVTRYNIQQIFSEQILKSTFQVNILLEKTLI